MYILFDFYIPDMHGEIRQAKNIQTVADLWISIKNKLQEYKLLYFFLTVLHTVIQYLPSIIITCGQPQGEISVRAWFVQ